MKLVFHQRSRPVTSGRMHHKPGRLVDDNEVIVLKNDIEWDVFSERISGHSWWNTNFIGLTRFDPVVRLDYRDTALAHLPLFDQAFHPGPAETLEGCRQKPVEPFAIQRRIDLESVDVCIVCTHEHLHLPPGHKDQVVMTQVPAEPHRDTTNALGDDETIPGSFMTQSQVRKLKVAVIAMGVMLLAGFALVVITIVYQASQLGSKRTGMTPSPAAAVKSQPDLAEFKWEEVRERYGAGANIPFHRITLPEGAEILSAQPANGSFFVSVRDAGGLTVLNYDAKTWRLIGVTRLAPRP